jgi:VCBS repeat protein/FG-GAP repeat protein
MSVMAGDFNGDGVSDLAVASPFGGAGVLLGNGDGTFQDVVYYRVGLYPSFVTVGDFNGDGKADLAAANAGAGAGYTVSVLLGRGDGTFQPHVDYGTETDPVWVVVGDFNRDQKADLVVAHGDKNNLAGTVSVLLGKGDGTFKARVEYEAGFQPYGVAVGDFNLDGKSDLAVANQGVSGFNHTVSLLLGNGDGTFQAHVDYQTGTQPYSVAVADFNLDGKPDLAVASSESNAVSVLLGNGDGTFQPYVDYPASEFPISVAVGDFNRDGALDLVVVNGSCCIGPDTVSVLLGNGDGTFQAYVDYKTGVDPRSVVVGDSMERASRTWRWRMISTARSAFSWATAMAPFRCMWTTLQESMRIRSRWRTSTAMARPTW